MITASSLSETDFIGDIISKAIEKEESNENGFQPEKIYKVGDEVRLRSPVSPNKFVDGEITGISKRFYTVKVTTKGGSYTVSRSPFEIFDDERFAAVREAMGASGSRTDEDESEDDMDEDFGGDDAEEDVV